MVIHNHALLSVHSRKYWGKFVWTLFNQPTKEHKRYFARNWIAKNVYPSPNSKHGLIWKWSWKFQSLVLNLYLISMLMESFITLNIWIIKRIIFTFIPSSCKSESPWYVPVGSIPCSPKMTPGSTPFYRGLLINIYNVFSFWVQYPTSIYDFYLNIIHFIFLNKYLSLF